MTSPTQIAAQEALVASANLITQPNTNPQPFSSSSSSAAIPPVKRNILQTTLASLEPFRAGYKAFKSTGKVQRLIDINVTPLMAVELLKIAGENRGLAKQHLDKLMSDLTEGRWATRIDPGIIDWAGHLRGAQHTLTAIAETEVAAVLDFRVGLDEASVKVAGDSKPWTARDYVRDLADASIKLAVARYELSFTPGKGLYKRAVSNAEQLAYVAEHNEQLSEDIAAINFEGKELRGLSTPLAVVAFRRIVGTSTELGTDILVAREKAKSYFQELFGHDTIMLTDGPVFQVRELITGASTTRRGKRIEGTGVRSQNSRLSLVYDGWNRWMLNDTATKVRLRSKFVEPAV